MGASTELRPASPHDQGRVDAPRRDLGATAVWGSFGALGLALCAYLAFLILRHSWNFSPWLDGWLVIAFELAASLLCLSRVIGKRKHWRVALIMGLACMSWTAGDLALTLESLGGGSPPVPSVADIFYLGFFPLALTAIVIYVRGEIAHGQQPNWLDGAIAALGMAALCSGFAFHGLEKLFEGASLSVATNLAYPVADLLLLGLVAGSAVVVRARSRAALVLIALGMAVNATGDTFNFVGTSNHVGEVVNGIAWPASILVFAMSMWIGDRTSKRLALESLSGFLLPGIVTCSSLEILVLGNILPSSHRFGPLAVALATVTLMLTGIRLAFRPALRQAREQLRSSEDRYRLLFERNPQPLTVYDRHTLEIVAVSDAMVQKYGYSREDFAGMRIRDLNLPEERESTREYTAQHPEGAHRQHGSINGLATHHQLKNGTTIDVEVTSSNVELDGRECRIALYDDVTERNRVERELAIARDRAVEASNMKSAFLANMSHEIRTPMNGVIGMNDLLLTSDLNAEQRQFAEQVARSGEQMLALINDILDIAKLETGHIELDPGDFNLYETIEQSCAVAALQAVEKGLRFEVDIEPDVPRLVRGDGRRLQQVILNLVSNAVKFTSEGSIRVRVNAASHGAHGTRVCVSVRDTGIGIEPGKIERMFEPFTQADVSTTRIYGGTGLGLAIVRELVELMGGVMNAESEPGQGSVFWFELDLDPAQSSEMAGGSTGGVSIAPSWTSPPLVLVAEDSPVNQIVAARALERCGCRAEVVADGREALRSLEARHYDAVLMDCQMPVMDGYAATVELRRRETFERHTPVIAMTAHAMEGDRERCLAAGMDDYVSKPMRHADLAEALIRWIPTQPYTAGNGHVVNGAERAATGSGGPDDGQATPSVAA
jgi:PAS domain S-box-containing protein